MNADRFNNLLRELSTTTSHRNAVRFVAGSALGGLLGLEHLQAKAKRGKGNKGKKDCKTKGKTTICHNGRTIDVSNCELKAHEKHGDLEGPCPAPTCGTGGTCHVFVTSTIHQGNFGELTAGDAICQQRAQAAGLPGTYKAWLSDDTNSPNTRFVKSPGPYHLPDGTKVADSYADLISGSGGSYPDAVIDRTEFGQAVSSPFECWTFTGDDGSDFGGTDHCSNWTSTSGEGHYGRAVTTTHNWTNWNSIACSTANRLYCFQQS